jgi:hypothetical protein
MLSNEREIRMPIRGETGQAMVPAILCDERDNE